MKDTEIKRQIGILIDELWADGFDTGRKRQWNIDQTKIKDAEDKGYRRGIYNR